jgi:putative adenylate-forming enzyme
MILIDYLRLKRHRRFSEKRLLHYQLKTLKKMISYAKKHSPYYQESLKDLTLESLEDFKDFPTIDKTLLMANFDDINTEGIKKEDAMKEALRKELNKDYLGYYKDRYVLGLSSGTSGNKGLFITDKTLTKRLPGLFLARGGIFIKDLPLKILFLLRVYSQGFEDINAPFLSLAYQSTMDDMHKTMKRLNEERFNLLMAPPSYLRQIIKENLQVNVPLKRVITYAEVLTLEDKVRFETYFNTKVVELYQASEGQMASPCKEGHLHINEDLVYVELYDKEGNPINEPGVIGHEMIITNLINTVQPLIRYKMNDMIVLDDKCPCGSSFRRIKHVLGRHDDLIQANDQAGSIKVIYPDMFARWIITESDKISEFKVTQKALDKILVTVDLNGPFDLNQLKKRLEKELDALELSLMIEIEAKPIKLPTDKNKFKRFISTL